MIPYESFSFPWAKREEKYMIRLKKKARSNQTSPIGASSENRETAIRQEEPVENRWDGEIPTEETEKVEIPLPPQRPVKGKPEPPIYIQVRKSNIAKRGRKRKRKGH